MSALSILCQVFKGMLFRNVARFGPFQIPSEFFKIFVVINYVSVLEIVLGKTLCHLTQRH